MCQEALDDGALLFVHGIRAVEEDTLLFRATWNPSLAMRFSTSPRSPTARTLPDLPPGRVLGGTPTADLLVAPGTDDTQRTWAATSADGLHWTLNDEILGMEYFAAFDYDGYYYALTTRGPIVRSTDPIKNFESRLDATAATTELFDDDYRHFGVVVVDGDCLWVFYSDRTDHPEEIMLTTIDLTVDWEFWTLSPADTVLTPAELYEGEGVLDPFVYKEDPDYYLFYSSADELVIAVARLSGP